jgi:hypothetical protein
MDNEKQIVLMVKAANLKHPDFRLDCDLNWSVRQIKLHLSEHYPAKPVTKYYLSD